MTTRVQLVSLLRCAAPRVPSSTTGRIPQAGARWRYYATHSDRVPPSGSSAGSSAQGQGQSATTDSTAELLRRLEAESRRQGGASGFGGRESVGPFPLGVGASGRKKMWRPWGELGVSGKLWRTTQQTGNLAVILVGGSLFVILAFALTTELFATNSPSVLYSQAVDKIRASDALNPHLLPPLKFTHSPHSSAPVRGSPPLHHVTAKHPVSGRDHMLVTFWVHGRGKDEPEPLGWIKGVWNGIEENLRWAGGMMGISEPYEPGQDQQQRQVAATGNSGQITTDRGAGDPSSSWFGSLRNALSTSTRSGGGGGGGSKRGLPPPGTYKIGEVKAEYVKNASGQYTLLSLIIDVPSSRAAYPGKAIVYWSPEADTEGLMSKRR